MHTDSFAFAVPAAALAWAAFTIAHLLLNGRWWAWLAVSLLPPAALVAVPLLLLALDVPAAVGGGTGRPAALWSAGVCAACIAACAPQTGVNGRGLLRRLPRPGARSARGRHSEASDTVGLTSWNTEHWNQGRDTAAFYTLLVRQDSEVYLLQEYLHGRGDGEVWDIDDERRLRREFPRHAVSIGNNVVTLSSLPTAGEPKPIGRRSLRVDVVMPGSGGTVLSTYNVHIPVQLRLVSPLTRQFYRNIRARAADRRREYRALAADLRTNSHPCVIAGDFNTSPAIGELRWVKQVARDETRVLTGLYPVSWNARSRVPLWRLDWLFTRGEAVVERYELLDPHGLSDHRLQSALVRTVKKE